MKETAAKAATASCSECHQKNATNFVFSKYYPVLRAATPKKK